MTAEAEPNPLRRLTRRQLLKLVPPAAAAAAVAATLPSVVFASHHLRPIDPNLNPLDSYPNRGWEEVYRELYSDDLTFHFLCAPNDTHGCLLKAHAKNGVVKWVDPSYGYGQATDLYGNRASPRWDPRICISGHAYIRRFYSDRRVKGALIRQGFKDWVDAGMPRQADGLPVRTYFEGRGKETWLRVPYEEAHATVAKVFRNVAETYSGQAGRDRLLAQGYDPAMVDALRDADTTKTDGERTAGTRTMKVRGGMPFLSPTRFGAMYRFANMLALIDAKVRGVTPTYALGGRGWDNYAWHTDLPPGHPMVTGHKTSEFDLYAAEHSDVITLWGMNWIATKMPDGHWITEARMRGAQVITIATEYQSSSNKGDEVIVIRPSTDTALALGLSHVMLRDGTYDAEFVKRYTDLPLLVRMDTRKLLSAADVFPGYTLATLTNYISLLAPGQTPPLPPQQGTQQVPGTLRQEWGDFVVWDQASGGPAALTRDQVGTRFDDTGLDVALEGEFDVTLADGVTVVKARPVFDLVKQYIMENFDPVATSEITWAPVTAIESLAGTLAANRGKVLFATGMGPNHYWNADLKDRAIFLLAALTGNEGKFGGEVGSYAGNYRAEIFSGLPQWLIEDPFNPELDPTKPAPQKAYWKGESAHFYNYGDRPLRVGNKLFTGSTHMPTPSKTVWWANTNSILGNAKWAHDVIMNTLPKIEAIVVQEWFWTATCEYADVVLGVPSWIERKVPDVYASCTNPFIQAIVPTPIAPPYDLRDDLENIVGVAQALGTEFGDATLSTRIANYWRFFLDGEHEKYLQRVLDYSNTTKGYSWQALLASCMNGTPFLSMSRTSPRIVGWEQTNESKPWYNKTGRLESYRDEDEFIEYGENLPVWRETVDSTYYEPAVIVSRPHPAIAPKPPADYGISMSDLSTEVRQVRNVVKSWSELKQTAHPLMAQGYEFILYTPKYRHACHSMAASQDLSILLFGPYGDFYRHDRRTPYVGEGYVDMNPRDAKDLGVEDGDYVWVDGDPSDRPFRGWQGKPEDYGVMRWLVRARYYPNMPRKTARAWFHMHIATHGSVEGHATRADGLAKSPRTGYQAMYRSGSHQSVTRAWLKPTLLTDSLVRKAYYGQVIGKGFEMDVHGAVGAPKESFVKITRAEPGGIGGIGLWRPAQEGFRPTYESAKMTRYLAGDYGR